MGVLGFFSIVFVCIATIASADLPSVAKICVENDAAFVLHWSMIDLNTNAKSGDSGTYPVGQQRCLGISTIPNVQDGNLIQTSVTASGGITKDGNSAVIYSSTGYVAVYRCTGTTLIFKCKLAGFDMGDGNTTKAAF